MSSMRGLRMTATTAAVAFGLQLVGMFLLLFFRGGFEAIVHADSESYLSVARESWDWRILAGIRTFAYPLFLKGVHALSADARAVPIAQFAALNAAAALFYRGLRVAGAGRGGALAAAGYLLLTCYLGPQVDPGRLARQAFPPSYLLTEPLSTAAVIAWAGLLLAFVAEPRPARGIGLTLALFFAYQIRPSNVGLVALTPLVGILLGGRARAPAFLAIALVPFLLFCGLRRATVGHFGLVSFGGANSVCISGQLLTQDMLPRLSPGSRALGEILIAGRERVGWRSPRVGRYRISQRLAKEGCDRVLIGVAVPGVAARYRGDIVALNRDFGRFSLEVILLDPLSYLYNFAAGLASAARDAFLRPAFLLPAALFAALATVFPLSLGGPWAALALVAVSFFFTQMAAAVAVLYPFPRYVDAAMILLPLIPLGGLGALGSVARIVRSEASRFSSESRTHK